jgi:hypothetical protein
MGKQKVDLAMGVTGETHKEMEIQRGELLASVFLAFGMDTLSRTVGFDRPTL